MKRLFAVVLLGLMSLNVSAKISPSNRESHCKNVAEMAESLMESRQNNNLSIVKNIEIIDEMFKGKKDNASINTKKVMKAMLIDAYSKPAFMTDEYRQKAVNDFMAEYYLERMRQTAR